MKKEKLLWVQALRGIAVLMVTLFHIDISGRLVNPEWNLFASFKYFGYGGVNLFFVISGFIMVYISQDGWGNGERWKGFVLGRILRVYPTYLAIYAITFLVFFVWLGKPSCLAGNLTKIVGSLVLIHDPGDMCYVPQAWTLHWEIWFYLIFSVVFFLNRRLAIALGALWAAASVVIVAYQSSVSGWLFNWAVYNLHFLSGAAVCLAAPYLRGRALPLIALASGLFLGAAYLNAEGLMDTENLNHRLLQFVPASVLLLCGCLLLERSGVQPPRWLKLSGDASYSIYLVQLTILLVYRRMTAGMPHDFVSHTAWGLGALVACVGGGYLFYRIVEKPLIRFLKERLIPRRRLQAA